MMNLLISSFFYLFISPYNANLYPMKKLHLLLTALTLSLSSLSAQENAPTTSIRFWEATLPSGDFMVALHRITSISKHEYHVGVVKITEVVIDTDGNSLARFYTSEILSQADLVNRAIEKSRETLTNSTGGESGLEGNPVIKDYPTTTHAKTVEYNLKDVGAVDSLYNSIKRAWSRNNGAKFTAK